MKRCILLFSASFILSSPVFSSEYSVNAQEIDQTAEVENSAIQDFNFLKENLKLHSADSIGSNVSEIPIDRLSFDDEFDHEFENQRLVTYFYDDETIEIALYFIDDYLVYLGWTDYTNDQELIGQGFSADNSATITLEEGHENQFTIDDGQTKSSFDYYSTISESQRLTLEFLQPELEILINVLNLPDVSEIEEDTNEEDTTLDYSEFVDNPAWIGIETDHQIVELINAYESLKETGEFDLDQSNESTDFSEIYYANTDNEFAMLEITDGADSLVTLSHYTSEIYTAFPDDINVSQNYTSQELIEYFGPVTISQYNQADETERFAWIRLDNDDEKVLVALLNAEGEYEIEFVETEEETS
ncbi:hypothetical protein HZY88_06450 [Aerococcaceae bacterium DSM 111176]|nr:hypothetical protein [Aerococcaceae bacterium DSM 111176]